MITADVVFGMERLLQLLPICIPEMRNGCILRKSRIIEKMALQASTIRAFLKLTSSWAGVYGKMEGLDLRNIHLPRSSRM
jgi:hypothetical protein